MFIVEKHFVMVELKLPYIFETDIETRKKKHDSKIRLIYKCVIFRPTKY